MSRGYDKSRLVKIAHTKRQNGRSYRYRRTSDKNIKEILRDAGYTDKQIAKMNKQGRILIGTGYLSTHLKPGQELYVLDIPEDHDLDQGIDRFAAIELD